MVWIHYNHKNMLLQHIKINPPLFRKIFMPLELQTIHLNGHVFFYLITDFINNFLSFKKG